MDFEIKCDSTFRRCLLDFNEIPMFDANSIQGIGVSNDILSLVSGNVMVYDSTTMGWEYGGGSSLGLCLNDLCDASTTGTTGIVLDIDAVNKNVFMGQNAGESITSGASNTFIGDNAGEAVTTDIELTAVGANAGEAGGTTSVFVGFDAGRLGSPNDGVFVGHRAGRVCASSNCTIVGADAGAALTSGSENTFVGVRAGNVLTLGSQNTFVGSDAGDVCTIGNRNVSMGEGAGTTLSSGNQNTMIGYQSRVVPGTVNQTVVLGARARAIADGEFALGSFTTGDPVGATINTQATVGLAGAAAAPPASPATYLEIRLNGTLYVIPCYNP